MQITIDIPDEFIAMAMARGLAPKSYIEGLIAAQAAIQEESSPASTSSSKLSREEFNASLDALARYSDKIPAFPIEAFSRESFYEDRI